MAALVVDALSGDSVLAAGPAILTGMRITWDPECDAAYVSLADDIATGACVRGVEVSLGGGRTDLVLDLDADGRLLGVEVLSASARLRPELRAGATGAPEPDEGLTLA